MDSLAKWTVVVALVPILVASSFFAGAREATAMTSSSPATQENATGDKNSPDSPADEHEAKPDADGVYQVGGRVTAPQLLSAPDPAFPDKARKKRLHAVCTVGLVVKADGMPQSVHVVRSSAADLNPKLGNIAAEFDANAVKAVEQYKFKPATLRGRPVPVEVHVEVNFRIY